MGSFHKHKLTIIETKFALEPVECKLNCLNHHTMSQLSTLVTCVDPKSIFSPAMFLQHCLIIKQLISQRMVREAESKQICTKR